ncbi:MAG: acyltransferase [Kineosporiaceae bacterium]
MTAGVARIPSLDGIRAVAIGGGFGIHANGALPGGHLGVSVFFVLSGYLITTLLLEEHRQDGAVDFRRFYLRRGVRLLPALFVVLLVYSGFLLITGTSSGEVLTGVLASALYSGNLVHAYVPSLEFSDFTWSWTLSLEEQFYFLWPAVLIAAARRGALRRIAVALAVLLLVSEALRVFLPLGDPDRSARIYAGVDTRMSGLLLGALLALFLAARPVRMSDRWAGLLAGGSVAAILASYMFARLGTRPAYALWIPVVEFASAGLVLAVLSRPDGSIPRSLAWEPVTHVGRISYGLYLWNIPAYHLTQDLFAAGTPVWKTGSVWLLATFTLAEVSFYGLERPVQRRWRGAARPLPQEHRSVLVNS